MLGFVRSLLPLLAMLPVCVCLTDGDLTKHSGLTCAACLDCLPTTSKHIRYTNGAPHCSWHSKGHHKFYCPVTGQIEHFYFRQLLYLYPEETRAKVPCADACWGCVTKIRHWCPSIEPLSKSFLAGIYPDLLKPNNTQLFPPNPKPPQPPRCTREGLDTRQKRETCDTVGRCCDVTSILVPYTTQYVDPTGETWEPIWFDEDGHDSAHPAVYQMVEEVSCSSGSCCSSCDKVYTSRSIAMTTWPSTQYGHKYTIFSDWIFSNIEFVTVWVPGYCQCIH